MRQPVGDEPPHHLIAGEHRRTAALRQPVWRMRCPPNQEGRLRRWGPLEMVSWKPHHRATPHPFPGRALFGETENMRGHADMTGSRNEWRLAPSSGFSKTVGTWASLLARSPFRRYLRCGNPAGGSAGFGRRARGIPPIPYSLAHITVRQLAVRIWSTLIASAIRDLRYRKSRRRRIQRAQPRGADREFIEIGTRAISIVRSG